MLQDDDEFFLSEEDKALWEKMRQSIDHTLPGKAPSLRPSKKKEVKKKVPVTEVDPASLLVTTEILPRHKTDLPRLEPGTFVGIDRNMAKKLREGKVPIEARLDLHGKTQEEAFEALRFFLQTAYHMGKRCVLVITGKGSRDGEKGVLRKYLPEWLNLPDMRSLIIVFAQAEIRHGGEGAFYVLLKKKK